MKWNDYVMIQVFNLPENKLSKQQRRKKWKK